MRGPFAPTAEIASITAPGSSSDTNVRAPGTSISVAFGNSAASRLPSAGVKARSR